jgi:hypothetical protein
LRFCSDRVEYRERRSAAALRPDRAHGENAREARIHVEFTAKYDGQDNPVTGSSDFNSIALKRVD